VGSVLVGTEEFIDKARRYRRIFGGSWRQAGILAAAGLYALDHHVDRLAEDHANAQHFAERTSGVPNLRHVFESTPTNIVFLDVSETGRTAAEASGLLRKNGVGLSVHGETILRAVTHLDVCREDIDHAAQVVAETLA